MSNPAPITFEQLFRFYRALPHQMAAVAMLEGDIRQNGYDVAMRRDRPWFLVWSQSGKQDDITAPAAKVLLSVPYEFQLDNSSGTGYRECFSSSCAMVAEFHDCLKGGDDAYNRVRAQFGDSTDAQAQIKALRSLGLEARLVTNGTLAMLEAELRAGRPTPVGWLHKGSITAPSGGGHWTVAIGFDAEAITHNDPNGEADMVGGGYVRQGPSDGKGVRYSRANWGRRWMADGNGTGWMMLIRKP